MKKKVILTMLAIVALAIGIEALQTMHMKKNEWKNSGGNGVCDFLYPDLFEGTFTYKSHKGKATFIPIICIGDLLLVYNAIEGGPTGIASYHSI
ncbi:MAG: hypothetical protein J6V98_04675 [Bacteroidales bacterium]|nr:hypothetical protein [Bacteroidales bacterium]